jgi:probable HAF family extracellular repeat protein
MDTTPSLRLIRPRFEPHHFPGLGAVAGMLATAVLSLAAAAPAGAATWYTVKDLGTLPGDTDSIATGLNNNGDVVGWSNGPNGYRGFLYTPGSGMTVVPGLPNRPRAFPRDINDVGDIVGTADAGGVDLGHAVRWRGGVPQDLGALPNGPYSAGWGINNRGDVAGDSYTQVNGINLVHGFIYTDATGMVDLTPGGSDSSARDINDAGQVTGYRIVGGYHAFRWQGGAFTDLGVLPGMAHSFGFAIEPGGGVAGSSKSASGNSERVIRYTDANGLQDLGGVGEHNQAWGINSALTVVGQLGQGAARAFVYTDGEGLRNLNDLVDKSQGWVLQTAFDINDAGQIVGYGYNNLDGNTHAVLLAPTTKRPPECSVKCLRSKSVRLSGALVRQVAQVDGKVLVKDENGNPVADAMVTVTWAHPDGSTHDQYAWTSAKGSARLDTSGPQGTYELDVISIIKSLYTFNPKKSELTGSVTVP